MKTFSKSERHKRAFLAWLAIYPLITTVLFFLGDALLVLPFILRTFVLTLIIVPLMSYLIMPLFNKLFNGWLVD